MNLSVHVRIQRSALCVEADVSLSERVVGLFGPSGSGKTTLLHAIAGIVRPQQGQIVHNDRVLFDAAARVCMPPHRRRVGVVFQDMRLFPHLTVRDNLRFGGRAGSASEGGPDLTEIADELGLSTLLSRQPAALSGGECRRVALGRAIVASPELLLLDEPLAGLDTRLRRKVQLLLMKVRDKIGIPLVYVAHDITEILALTDYVLCMEHGRVCAAGRYRDLMLDERPDADVMRRAVRNVIPMRVDAHDDAHGCTRLVCAVHRAGLMAPGRAVLTVLRQPLAVGSSVSVVVRAEDIAIATQQVAHLSVQNQLVGTVTKHASLGYNTMLEVDVGTPLLVEITRAAFDRLGLRNGRRVHCLIKANAIELV